MNAVGVWVLRGGKRESDERGAYLKVIGDALGPAGVIVAAIVVLTTGWQRADPLIAAGIGFLIVPRTWRLLQEAVNVPMEGTPPHLDVAAIERVMRADPAVAGSHDLHIWTLTSGRDAMSGHVLLKPGQAGSSVTERLHGVFQERFGVEHTTIQVEYPTVVPLENKRVGS